MVASSEYRVYVGAYTSGAYTGEVSPAEGIALALAAGPGRLGPASLVARTPDPSFLALSPDGSVLFAVNELGEGRVTSFAVRPDGGLTEINSQPSHGSAPCHLSVHPSGKHLLTANYASGNLVVHPIGEGGVLRAACHAVQHSGSGPVPHRQEGPHAHQVLPDPSGRHVIAVDLGTDAVYVYDFDVASGHMAIKHEAAMQAGAGPRHLAFHPSGTRAYLISELGSTMTEFGFDPESGTLEPRRTLPTLPTDYPGTNLASEVVVSGDGRFVFGSNRGHDSLAVYSADEDDMRLLGIHPAGVAGPRHIALSPDSGTLFVAGEKSGSVQAFVVDDFGTLTPVGDPVAIPRPVCLLPVPNFPG